MYDQKIIETWINLASNTEKEVDISPIERLTAAVTALAMLDFNKQYKEVD